MNYLAVGLLVLLAACAKTGPAQGFRVDIAGAWVLDEASSESPLDSSRVTGTEGRSGRGPIGGRGGMGGMGGRGGMPGRGGQGILPGSQERIAVVRDAVQALRRAGSSVTITIEGDAIALQYADGSIFRLPASNERTKVAWSGVGEVNARATWKDGALVFERELAENVEVRETYSRAPGAERLLVTVAIASGTALSRTFRRVYDRKR